MIRMDTQTLHDTFQGSLRCAANQIQNKVGSYKELAKAFYFEVLYSIYKCLKCTGKLVSSAPGHAVCSCGAEFDPTIVFQKSSCCGANLKRKVLHYVCRECGKPVRSRFLFDERLFDLDYLKPRCRNRGNANKRIRKNSNVCWPVLARIL